jgi:CO dehydrogenase maturation factor
VLRQSIWVRQDRRTGPVLPIAGLEPHNVAALAVMQAALDRYLKDWARYASQAADFHARNATAWGNDRTGEDLIRQIDPHFVLGPAATAAVH